MAITELYVDPSIAGNSGAGTAGNPYGDLQWLADQEAFDTTNGTRISVTVGDGTAEISAAGLDFATNFFNLGGPSATAPLVIQGCKNESPLVAGDGDWTTQAGIGRIDCNNNKLFAANNQNYIFMRHLEIFGRAGAGYDYLIYLGTGLITECELHTHSGTQPMIRMGNYGKVRRCHLHNQLSAEHVCFGDAGTWFEENYINVGGSTEAAIVLVGSGGVVQRNTIRLNDTTNVNGIVLTGTGTQARGNSIWSAAGIGKGISGAAAYAKIVNNAIAGFSGAGGRGIEKTSGSLMELGGNHVFDCTTNYNVTVPVVANYGDNEDLSGSSPFTNASGQDFTPVDVGNMKQGAFPPSIISGDAALTAAMKMWKGALEPAGGGGSPNLFHGLYG